MSDDQPGRQRPDYSADLSDTPEDTPDSPAPTRRTPGTDADADDAPAAAGTEAGTGPEVRRVRADDLRDDAAAPVPLAPPTRRRSALVGAGLLGIAALAAAFALGRATADDDGPETFDPASVGAAPGGPFGDHDFGEHGDWGPGDGRHHRWPGPGADRPGPGGWDDHFGPGDRPDRDQDQRNGDDDNSSDDDDQGDDDTGE